MSSKRDVIKKAIELLDEERATINDILDKTRASLDELMGEVINDEVQAGVAERQTQRT